MKYLPVYRWPAPPLPLPVGVTAVQSLPGSPGTTLGLNARPPWFCDAAVVTTPEGVPAAIEVILSGRDDPRIHTAAQWLEELMPGAREMSDLELRREDLDRD